MMAGFSKAPVILPATGIPGSPTANGMQCWTYDPFLASATTTIGSGVGVFSAFIPTQTIALSTTDALWLFIGTAPTTTSYGAMAIYNAAGTRLAISSNVNAFGTANAVSSTLAAGVTLYAGVTYYLAFMCVYTVGTFVLWGFSGTNSSLMDNINIATPGSGLLGYRSQMISSLATLPAQLPAGSPVALSSAIWMGIS
jgi:hypothetical protein